MKRLSNRKAAMSLADVPPAVIMLVVLAIVIGIGASVLTSSAKTQCAGVASGVTYSYENNTCWRSIDSENRTLGGPIAYNASTYGVTGMNTFGQWLPTIAVVVAAAVIVGLVMAYLAFKRSD